MDGLRIFARNGIFVTVLDRPISDRLQACNSIVALSHGERTHGGRQGKGRNTEYIRQCLSDLGCISYNKRNASGMIIPNDSCRGRRRPQCFSRPRSSRSM